MTPAAKARERIIKRVAYEFKNGMYGMTDRFIGVTTVINVDFLFNSKFRDWNTNAGKQLHSKGSQRDSAV